MNKIILTGRLGHDAELKYLDSGKNVTKFSIAVEKNYKREGDAPTWVNCQKWNAENLSNYLTKGKHILVEGELKIDPYEKDGEKKQLVYVNVDRLEFLGGETKQQAPGNDFDPSGLDINGYGAVDDDDVPF